MDKEDRVWFLRQGKDPRGIFAMGTVVTPPFVEKFLEEPTRTGLFVDCQIEWIVNPETDPDQIIPRPRLDDSPFSKVNWNTQSSGIHIPDDVASALQEELQRWSRVVQLELATPNGDVAGSYTISVPATEEERLRAELATHPTAAEEGVLDGYADHLGYDLDQEEWEGWTWRPRQTEDRESGHAAKSPIAASRD